MATTDQGAPRAADQGAFRAATFNASLNRAAEGGLVRDLGTPDDAQARAVAEIVQRVAPDVLLVNEFDYVAGGAAADLFRANYLDRPQDARGVGAADPVSYPYAFVAPSNTGIASGFDLNNDGAVVTAPGAAGYGDDALGFGAFPGQFGMALFSRFPILQDQVRTFQTFLWKDMPGARLPDDAATVAPADWYSAAELAALRLPSKSFWDVPVLVDGEVVHLIALHPTPPTFDGAEDRNGLRNADEIRLAADYVTPGRGGYVYDDAGRYGGLPAGARFVVLGDLNADPADGDSADRAIRQLLDSPAVDASLRPASAGAAEQAARQGGANATQSGDPAFDTADFADGAPGNLRVDYALPSAAGLAPRAAGVFWPASDDPLFPLVGTFDRALPGGFPSSDHRLVWTDLALSPVPAPGFATLDGRPPVVIAHRGASAERPEHTLEAYARAIAQGADAIEPDLVPTKDGVLIARHEPEIGGTSDVSTRPEFADRRTTKVLDGVPVTGWFAEDFTLAEIKTLYARERIPGIRPDNAAFDDLFRIPTLAEVVRLVRETEAATGRRVGIVPETKHPTYFEFDGLLLDGTPIGIDTGRLLVDTLVAEGFTDPARVLVQSFELANLIELQTGIMPAAGIDLPLVQLLNEGGYDIAFNLDPANAGRGGDAGAYAGFAFPLTAASALNGDLYTQAALRAMAALYAEAIGPYKDDLLPVETVSPPVDGNGDGIAQIGRRVTGQVTPLLDDARAAGLKVIIYTLRDEEAFQSLNPDGSVRTPAQEYDAFVALGVDGFFTDSPASGRAAVERALGDPAAAPPAQPFTFLGTAALPFGTTFGGQQIGGLSALTYDAARDRYYALSDDRSPDARFFTLEIAVGDGRLSAGDVTFTGVRTLSDRDGRPFTAGALDPEGLVLTRDGGFLLSSEGDANALIPPFAAAFDQDGRRAGDLPVAAKFLPTADRSSGIRNNLAFEALSLTPDGERLYVGTENALYQDGPAASPATGSPARIFEYDARTGTPLAEYVYPVEPVRASPVPEGAFATNGLVELLGLDNAGRMLALERSFSTGVGNDVSLYLVATRGATDVTGLEALRDGDYAPLSKRKLLDLGDLGLTLDNLEGMTFGPDLADGRRTLILVSDDNFSATQTTQFLAFAFDPAAIW